MIAEASLYAEPAPRPLALYAARFARKCLLEYLCASDHPILEVERRLLDSAKKSLHEFLLASPNLLERSSRRSLEKSIRSLAAAKVAAITDDEALCRTVMAAVRKRPLDDAFPSVN